MKTHTAKQDDARLTARARIEAAKMISGPDATYLILRTKRGAHHVFVQTKTKEGAKKCGLQTTGSYAKVRQALWDAAASELRISN